MIELRRDDDIGSNMATGKVLALNLLPIEKLVWLVVASTLCFDISRIAVTTGLAPAEVSDIIDRTWHTIDWVVPVTSPSDLDPQRTASPFQRQVVMERDGFACRHCGTGTDLQIDHIVAHSQGGLTEVDNMQVLCRTCNMRKGTRPGM